MAAVLGIGYYFYRRNKTAEDYYVGSRSISPSHIGLSVVATDVGGGFSIGLGGVGFTMGLSGSWLLFTGLVGAWLTAVFMIPKVKKLDTKHGMLTYPDFLLHKYNAKVALAAGIISGIGYLGFTGAQVLAGAKLISATIIDTAPLGMNPLTFSLLTIGVIIIGYTVLGGLKAVIYTDTVQWIILLSGLILIASPLALYEIGGFAALKESVPAEFLTLTNITWVQFFNWMITIVPIWFIAMTLYQRIYATKSVKDAKKAWYIAGVFEYPVMAFTGVFLGMCGRVLFPEVEPEMGMLMAVKYVLPAGVTGIIVASYFSAIMSTADSCLMASSGNFVNDFLKRYVFRNLSDRQHISLSQLVTLGIGALAIILASRFTTVLDAIMYAYSFMVSGLFIPTLGAYFWKKHSSAGALWGMISGGTLTLVLIIFNIETPFGLDHTFFGIVLSGITFIALSLMFPDRKDIIDMETDSIENNEYDVVEIKNDSLIQHGKYNDRIYVMKLAGDVTHDTIEELENLAGKNDYSKIFAKIPSAKKTVFIDNSYVEEGHIPGYFKGKNTIHFLSKFLKPSRKIMENRELIEKVLKTASAKDTVESPPDLNPKFTFKVADKNDIPEMAELYKQVFKTYPFPIHEESYLEETIDNNVVYFTIRKNHKLVALSSSEMDKEARSVEMTDFATLPDYRGEGFALFLLNRMENEMQHHNIRTAYTIARAVSYGMNIVFSKMGYKYSGTLVNNTNISGNLESMNIWWKKLA